jgi:signal transduction histidine kinase
MANLISNAAKHTPRGERVTIALSARDGAARFEVIDRGPGIPTSFRDRIFEKFAQAEAAKGTTGLGLSICKAFVERLGGRIGYVTENGRGTTFWFELPLAP